MGINPIELGGIIQRAQDVGMLQKKEESKPFLDQQNILAHQKKEDEHLSKSIKQTEETYKETHRFDAKEKGNGEYHPFASKKNKKKKMKSDAKVNPKKNGGHFDVKV